MKKILIGLGIIAAIAVIVLAAISRSKESGEPVYAGEVSRGDIVTVVRGTGSIQPRTKVNVSSEIYGQIVELPVKEGQSVRKGDLLVRIDPEKYRSEAERLSANVRVSRISVESEEVNLRNLQRELERQRRLHRGGILSESEMDKAELAVESSRIHLKSLRESVAQAEAAMSRAKDDLAKTTIYAPMAGKVTQVNTEVGEQVIVGTTNVPGSVILVISDMSEILAEVNVDETEVVKVAPAQSVEVTADAVEKTTYSGRVTEIGNTARKQGDVNVFEVKILLTDPDGRLRPGMTAKAKIEVDSRRGVLRVPIQAVTVRERKKLEEEKKAANLGKPATGTAGGAEGREVASEAAAAEKEDAPPGAGAATAAAEAASAGERAGAPAEPSGPTAGTAAAASEKGESAPPGTDAARAEGEAAGTGEIARGSAAPSEPPATAAAAPDDAAGEAAQGERRPVPAGASPEARTTRAEPAGSDGGKAPAEPETETGEAASEPRRGERDEIEVVYVIEDKVVRAVPVKTGASDETYVEIIEGLGEGQSLVKGPYRVLRRLKEGDRVVKKEESAEQEGGGIVFE